MWVPGHCGIIGHDIADTAAKDQEPDLSLPLLEPGDLRNYIRNKITDSWRTEWLLSNGKLRTIKEDVTNWTKIIGPICESRSLERATYRLFLGHTTFSHQFLLSRLPPPECDTCHLQITVLHLINECSKYQRPLPDLLTLENIPLLHQYILSNQLLPLI